MIWQRVKSTREKLKAEAENAHHKEVMFSWLMSKSFYHALQANRDLPPTRKEANRKKPDWSKIEKSRKEQEEYLRTYQEAHTHPYNWEKFMGLNPSFDAPAAKFKSTSKAEFRKERKRFIADMEKRLVADMKRIAEVHGDIHFDQLQPT